MFIYLAQPIDQSRPNHRELKQMVGLVEAMVSDQGHTAFKPGRAYQVGYATNGFPRPKEMKLIDTINQHALHEADGVVAILPAGVATLGVPAEIELALSIGTPVHIVASPSLVTHSVQIGSWMERGVSVSETNEEVELSHALRLAAGPQVDAFLAKQKIDISGFGDTVPTWVEGKTVKPGDLQVRYDPAAKLLTRAHDTDAGLDLATSELVTLAWGVRTLIHTGVYAPPPEGWWGLIKARSSTQAMGIQINEAVIDAGYQGELMISATVVNTGKSNMTIDVGTRLAQYILVPTFPGKVVEVVEFGPSLRGDKGWGSSGS